MSLNARKLFTTATTAGILAMSLAYHPAGHAFNFGDMMNLGRWMGGDRYLDYYDGPYAGPWGVPYGGGPWSGPWEYGPPGFYGAGPYGIPGYRGTLVPSVPTTPMARTPSQATTRSSELDELKRRIKELESQRQPTAAPAGSRESTLPPPSNQDFTPTFRPLDQK